MVESALCLAIAVVALVGTQHLVRRAVEAGIRQSAQLQGSPYVPRRTTARTRLTEREVGVEAFRMQEVLDPETNRLRQTVTITVDSRNDNEVRGIERVQE